MKIGSWSTRVYGLAFSLLAVVVLSSPAFATSIHDSDTVTVDASDPVDLGLVNEEVENAVPDLVDEWADIAIGGCSMTASGVTRSGMYVTGSASISCSGSQRAASIKVCIQRRNVDRWTTLVDSCRTAAADGGSASATATTVCTPGTWTYRLYAIGEVVGSTINVVGNKGVSARIACPIVMGEGNP